MPPVSNPAASTVATRVSLTDQDAAHCLAVPSASVASARSCVLAPGARDAGTPLIFSDSGGLPGEDGAVGSTPRSPPQPEVARSVANRHPRTETRPNMRVSYTPRTPLDVSEDRRQYWRLAVRQRRQPDRPRLASLRAPPCHQATCAPRTGGARDSEFECSPPWSRRRRRTAPHQGTRGTPSPGSAHRDPRRRTALHPAARRCAEPRRERAANRRWRCCPDAAIGLQRIVGAPDVRPAA